MNAPPPATDAPPIPAPPRTKLAWLPAADAAIAILVVLLAGFVAAYASRNSDQWIHFAAGRDLLNGKYSLGTDPYSYLHETWVNHSWLYDVVSHQLFNISGAAVTLCKAAIVALAFFVVLRIRKPGTPAWPWWLFATVGVLAAAPQTTLRPPVVSALLIALSLHVLFRARWAAGSWRNPILLAAICALWANVDQWFFLGPATVAVVLLAEVIQRKLLKVADADAPQVADLAKALLLSLAATLANPHFFGVWELPLELGIGLPAGLREDSSLALLGLPAYSPTFYKRPDLGGNLNGAAFLVLLVVGGGLLALGMSRVRLACLFVWMLFAAVAMMNYRSILFFAIAAVPMAATPLADLASRFAEDPQSRLSTTLSPLARLLALPALLILLFCAWPGWLHPKPGDLAYVNRVALGVEPDPGLARMAKTLNDWHESGKLGGDLHGAPLGIDMANHIAWFAPKAKVAVNSRYNHHRADLPGFLEARGVLADDYRIGLHDALKDVKADYLILTSASPTRAIDVNRVLELGRDATLWHLDGRAAVIGPAKAGLKFDAVAQAFALDQQPLPDPAVVPPPSRTRDPFDDFVQSPKAVPVESLDAMALQTYAALLWAQAIQQQQERKFVGLALAGAPALLIQPNESILPEAAIAANLLAQRAARQGMAQNPDHPLAYLALALCANERDNPMPGFNPEEQQTIYAANARRFLDRMPLPGEVTNFADAFNVWRLSKGLSEYYKERQMHDLYRDAMKVAIAAYRRQLQLSPIVITPEQMKAELDNLDKTQTKVDKEHGQRLENSQAAASAPLPQRFQAALQSQLPGEALKLMKDVDFDKEFGTEARLVEFIVAQLRLRAGLLEEAVQSLSTLQEKLKLPAADASAQAVNAEVVRQLASLVPEAQRIAGDYASYGKSMDEYRSPKQPLPAAMRDQISTAIGSAKDLNLRLQGVPHGALGSALGLSIGQAVESQPINFWLRESDYYRRRGLVALLNGQVKEAKSYFEKALTPEGIPLPAFLGERAAAERYLNLINAAK